MATPNCIILGNTAVNSLLTNLTTSDIALFQSKQESTLLKFSTVPEERTCQPDPGVVQRSSGQKVLFRPFTSPTSVGTKIIVHPAPEPGQAQAPLHGVIVLCDRMGFPTGMINAEEVTGFRTSLSAIIPWTWRRRTERVVVFGAGKQAEWHLRLALKLRGGEIKSIAVVNRSKGGAEGLVEGLRREGLGEKVEIVAMEVGDERAQEFLGRADVVFCTVPSEEPVFEMKDLGLEKEGRARPYVSAIGSWTANMIELDPALLKRAVADESGFNPNSDGKSTGVVIVDDAQVAPKHAGEIIQSGLGEDEIVEVGKVLDLKKNNPDAGLTKWLEEGLVVYKSVGVSLTDLSTGEAILELAKKQGHGTVISDL